MSKRKRSEPVQKEHAASPGQHPPTDLSDQMADLRIQVDSVMCNMKQISLLSKDEQTALIASAAKQLTDALVKDIDLSARQPAPQVAAPPSNDASQNRPVECISLIEQPAKRRKINQSPSNSTISDPELANSAILYVPPPVRKPRQPKQRSLKRSNKKVSNTAKPSTPLPQEVIDVDEIQVEVRKKNRKKSPQRILGIVRSAPLRTITDSRTALKKTPISCPQSAPVGTGSLTKPSVDNQSTHQPFPNAKRKSKSPPMKLRDQPRRKAPCVEKMPSLNSTGKKPNAQHKLNGDKVVQRLFEDDAAIVEQSPQQKNAIVGNNREGVEAAKTPSPSKGMGLLAKLEAETNSCPKRKNVSKVPWWRSSLSRTSYHIAQSKITETLKAFIMTMIKSSVRESWNRNELKQSYERDPSCAKGISFQCVASTLSEMDRARHMGVCRAQWSEKLFEQLLRKRRMAWSEVNPQSPGLTTCEACTLGHQATRKVRSSGRALDSRNYWPNNAGIKMLSSTEKQEVISIAIEFEQDNDVQSDAESSCDEFELNMHVDCLRKCLVFHELVHFNAVLSEDIKAMIEDELREGLIEIKKDTVQEGEGPEEMLHRYLIGALCSNMAFLESRVASLSDLMKLGNLYLSRLVDDKSPIQTQLGSEQDIAEKLQSEDTLLRRVKLMEALTAEESEEVLLNT